MVFILLSLLCSQEIAGVSFKDNPEDLLPVPVCTFKDKPEDLLHVPVCSLPTTLGIQNALL